MVGLAFVVGTAQAPGLAHTSAAPKPKRVVVTDHGFAPDMLTVQRGGAVRWVFPRRNEDAHNVTARRVPDGVPRRALSSDRLMPPGDVFKRTFVKIGTYGFYCSLHPEMTMRVNVVRRAGSHAARRGAARSRR